MRKYEVGGRCIYFHQLAPLEVDYETLYRRDTQNEVAPLAIQNITETVWRSKCQSNELITNERAPCLPYSKHSPLLNECKWNVMKSSLEETMDETCTINELPGRSVCGKQLLFPRSPLV